MNSQYSLQSSSYYPPIRNSSALTIKNDPLSDFAQELHERLSNKVGSKNKKKIEKKNKQNLSQHTFPKIQKVREQQQYSIYTQNEKPIQKKSPSLSEMEEFQRKIQLFERQIEIKRRLEKKLKQYGAFQMDFNSRKKEPQKPQVIVVQQPHNQCQCNHHCHDYRDYRVKYPRNLSPLQGSRANISMETGKKVKSEKKLFSENDRKRLKRKLKVVFMAVYFTILFPKYSKLLLYEKYKHFKLLNYSNLYNDVKDQILNEFYKINFIETFLQIEELDKKDSEKASEIFIVQKDIEFSMGLPLIWKFVMVLLDQILEIIKKERLAHIYPILKHFYKNSFPLSSFFLKEQAEIIKFHEKTGQMLINKDLSIFLLTNFFIFKILIYETILNKENSKDWLKKAYEKKKIHKKLLRLVNQKLKIVGIFLYNVINCFFRQIYKKKNYHSLPHHLKTQLLEAIQYDFMIQINQQIDQKKKSSKQINLIQNITGIIQLQEVIDYFYEEYSQIIKSKMQQIGEEFFQQARSSYVQELQKNKQKIINRKFFDPEFSIDLEAQQELKKDQFRSQRSQLSENSDKEEEEYESKHEKSEKAAKKRNRKEKRKK